MHSHLPLIQGAQQHGSWALVGSEEGYIERLIESEKERTRRRRRD